jgi:uncharacterized protein YqeY
VADPSGPSDTSLKQRLAQELRDAMKAQQRVRIGALRLLTAAVKNREVELGHGLSDEEFVEVASREIKRRREAIEAYESAGRPDRADREREEQRAIDGYVPAELSQEEVDALIADAIAATAASGPGDLGKVMGRVMAAAKGRADGRAVQAKVKERLGAT